MPLRRVALPRFRAHGAQPSQLCGEFNSASWGLLAVSCVPPNVTGAPVSRSSRLATVMVLRELGVEAPASDSGLQEDPRLRPWSERSAMLTAAYARLLPASDEEQQIAEEQALRATPGQELACSSRRYGAAERYSNGKSPGANDPAASSAASTTWQACNPEAPR